MPEQVPGRRPQQVISFFSSPVGATCARVPNDVRVSVGLTQARGISFDLFLHLQFNRTIFPSCTQLPLHVGGDCEYTGLAATNKSI